METNLNAAFTAWTGAVQARIAFYKANERNWTSEVDYSYRELSNRAESLWHAYLSARSGKSIPEVSASISESIHSARD